MPTSNVPMFEFRPLADFGDWLDDKITTPGGASTLGHHFIQAYNEDKYGFYLRYIRGLRPAHTKPALLFGGAIHDAKEAFYTFSYNEDVMVTTFNTVMDARRDQYDDPETFNEDRSRGTKMLLYWANEWSRHDEDTYDILEVEGSHTFTLANNFTVSYRNDLLVRRRDNNNVYIIDTKTTGYSVAKAFDSVQGQDQATMYLLGAQRTYPSLKIVGLIPDILYKRSSVIKAERPGIVFRSRQALLEYEQELIGLHVELTQKVIALEQGFPYPHMLFPRNGKNDSVFGTQWPELYRMPLPADPHKAPAGYVVDHDLINNGPYGNPSLRANIDYNQTLDLVTNITQSGQED